MDAEAAKAKFIVCVGEIDDAFTTIDKLPQLNNIEDLLNTLTSINTELTRTHHIVMSTIEPDETENQEKAYNEAVAKFVKVATAMNTTLVFKAKQELQEEQRKLAEKRDNIKGKIANPKFAGNYEEWIEFEKKAQAIIEAKDSDDEEKQDWLKQSISGYPEIIVAKCVEAKLDPRTMLAELAAVYENKTYAIIRCLNDLESVDKRNAETPASLQDLLSEIGVIHDRLEAIEPTATEWSVVFAHKLLTRLPTQTWEEWLVNKDDPKEMPSYKEVEAFVRKRATAKQNIEGRQKLSYGRNTTPSEYSATAQHKPTMRAEAGAVDCFNCKKPHRIYRCHQLILMPLNKRVERISELHLCDKCLHPEHLSGERCLANECPHCKGGHNGIICPINERKLIKERAAKQAANQNTDQENDSDGHWNPMPNLVKAGTSNQK